MPSGQTPLRTATPCSYPGSTLLADKTLSEHSPSRRMSTGLGQVSLNATTPPGRVSGPWPTPREQITITTGQRDD